jgi:hypothetical protein
VLLAGTADKVNSLGTAPQLVLWRVHPWVLSIVGAIPILAYAFRSLDQTTWKVPDSEFLSQFTISCGLCWKSGIQPCRSVVIQTRTESPKGCRKPLCLTTLRAEIKLFSTLFGYNNFSWVKLVFNLHPPQIKYV